MQERSEIILNIEPYSRAYIFFNFLLAVNNIILFDKEYNPDVSGKFKQEHFKEYNLLQRKFLFWDEKEKGSGSLSFPELLSLLKTVKRIAKALLAEEADIIAMISKKLMVLTNNLQQDFFITAQYVFQPFKEQFDHIPEFNQVMEIITGV